MPSSLYDLRNQVLALDASERDNLFAMIEHGDVRAPFEPNREDAEVWSVLTKLSPRGAVQHRVLDAFLRDRHHGTNKTAWRAAVATIYEFVAQAQPVRRPAQDHAALIELMLDCLVGEMRRRGEEVTPRTILNALPRLRGAVERAYPGYIDARMLHKLIRVAAPA